MRVVGRIGQIVRPEPIQQIAPRLGGAFDCLPALHDVGLRNLIVLLQEEAVDALGEAVDAPRRTVDEEPDVAPLGHAQAQIARRLHHQLLVQERPPPRAIPRQQEQALVGGRIEEAIGQARIWAVIVAEVEAQRQLFRRRRISGAGNSLSWTRSPAAIVNSAGSSPPVPSRS